MATDVPQRRAASARIEALTAAIAALAAIAAVLPSGAAAVARTRLAPFDLLAGAGRSEIIQTGSVGSFAARVSSVSCRVPIVLRIRIDRAHPVEVALPPDGVEKRISRLFVLGA